MGADLQKKLDLKLQSFATMDATILDNWTQNVPIKDPSTPRQMYMALAASPNAKKLAITGSCWEKLFTNPECFYTEDDYSYTRATIQPRNSERVRYCDNGDIVYKVRNPLARTLHDLIMMVRYSEFGKETELFTQCFCSRPVSNCNKCKKSPHNSKSNGPMTLWLEFSNSAEGALHLVGAKKMAQMGRVKLPPHSTPTSMWCDFFDLAIMCYSGYNIYAELAREPRNNNLFEGPKCSGVHYTLDLRANMIVGIEAEQMIEECKRLHTADLAKSQAQISFTADLRSTPKVNIKLSDSEKAAVKSYLGFAVMSNNKEFSTSDHKFLQVSRELIRRTMRGFFPEGHSAVMVLHIGCTMYEYKMWRSNEGHEFLLGMYQDKDVGRIHDVAVAEVAKILNIKKRRGIKNEAAMRTISHLGIDDILNTINASHSRKRIHTVMPQSKYSTLIFEDSLYDISEEQILDYFEQTGAVTGFATLFIPDVFVTDTTLSSDIYDYEEYYDDSEMFSEWLDKVWPQVLLLTPFLPWDHLLTVVHKVFHWLGTKGTHIVMDWLKGLPDAEFPFEEVTGVSFDIFKIKPIVAAISSALRKILKRNYCRSRVTWKGGYDAGYDHKWHCWRKWISTRRIVGNNGYSIDWSVHERIGEMYILRFYRSTGKDNIVFKMQLPAEKTTVMVADVQSAWNPVTKRLGPLKYFPILAKNWYQLYNWAMAEPPESLDFSIMLTTLNRIRGGLSLNSNVLVEAMRIQDTEAVKVALACLLEVLRVKGVICDINNVKENLISYDTNIKLLLKSLATTAATICTAGLIVPAAYLLKWMFDANPSYVFVMESVMPKVSVARGKKSRVTPHDILNSVRVDHIYRLDPESYDKSCFLCNCQAQGLFSATSPDEGQQFVCHTKEKKSLQKIVVTESQIVEIMETLTSAEEYHITSPSIPGWIKETLRYLEANKLGMTIETEIDFITGGPGTGKTVVIKEIANAFEDNGDQVVICVPFNALRNEYNNSTMLRGAEKTFVVKTPYHMLGVTSCDVLIVDEATAVSWTLVYAMLLRARPKRLFLVGDKNQTKLNTEQGEGKDILSHNLDWETIPKHEMIWNFRLDPWRVKYLNMKFGYFMRTRRQDHMPPEIITADEYSRLRDTLNISRELVFTHESSKSTFGYVSSAATLGTVENHSVRTSQGHTYDNVAVAYNMSDTKVATVHGMLCVAISRARFKTYFVVQNADDPHIVDLKKMLCINDQESIERIKAATFPEPPVGHKNVEIPDPRLDKVIDEKLTQAEITDTYESMEFLAKEPAPSCVTMSDSVSETFTARDDLYDYYSSIFHMCAPDLLLRSVSNTDLSNRSVLLTDLSNRSVSNTDDLKSTVTRMLGEYYFDDVMMGRVQQPQATSVQHPLRKRDGKFLLPLEILTGIITNLSGYMLLGEDYRVLAKNPDDNKVDFCYRLCEEHVFPFTEFDVPIPVYTRGKIWCARNALVQVSRRYIGEYQLIRIGEDFAFDVGEMPDEELYDYLPEHKIVPIEKPKYVGYLSITRFKPDLTRRQEINSATTHVPIMSSYKAADTVLQNDMRLEKFRAGKDAYRLGKLIDPSGALLTEPCINYAAPSLGPSSTRSIVINWEGFIFNRTKANKLVRRRQQPYRAIAPGMANHYNNSPEETLVAAQRLSSDKPKPRLCSESESFAARVAQHAFDTHFKALRHDDWLEYNAMLDKGLKDIKSRNYYGRAKAECGNFKRFVLKFHNKDQIKPIKNNELDISKGGQGILQTPADVNLEFVLWMRMLNKIFFDSKLPHLHYDNLIPTEQFRRELTMNISKMPISANIAIVDAKQFDSQQSEVTLEIERKFLKLLGAHLPVLDKYYNCRGKSNFRAFGLFKGQTNGEKGSGFPDTLLGNTILQTCMSTYVLSGIGPMCVAAKGDDHLRIQSGISVNKERLKELKTYTNMELKIDIGTGGEFCGDTITPVGAFPSINRAAVKTVAMRAINYSQFCEKQQALRDKIEEYKRCGLRETIVFGAKAEKVSINQTETALAFINSMAHINKQQWLQITRKFYKKRFFLPTASGPTII
uniref:Polyprotein n=1 Tax=Bemisia tabaci beny-like virus 5 TaxID=2840012 RepID=A0A8E8FVF8_9VIRU|nr:polyprotein [Bemisia tabaci beny-like virus 5]